jgi:hypothetical protein
MAFNFGHINAATIQAADKKPGHSDVALMAPIGDFTTLQGAISPAVNPGDSKKINTAHTFPVGKGFLELQCKPKAIEPGGDSQGEPGGQVVNYKYKVIVKGDSAEILEWLEQALNEDMVWLFNDPQCGVDKYVQLGSKCSPANISGFTPRGGSRGAGGFKEYEFTVESAEKYFYSGTVTKKP